MPYLALDRKSQWLDEGGLDNLLGGMERLIERGDFSPGDLNYLITQICQMALTDHPRYAHFNAVMGALQCAQLEFYRRACAPYEDEKIAENGDVYR